jgi:hypothetical protein
MAGTISTGEIEGWLHRMTVEPLPQDVVARVLKDQRRVQAERAALRAALQRLGPAWGELRAVLNEVNRMLDWRQIRGYGELGTASRSPRVARRLAPSIVSTVVPS